MLRAARWSVSLWRWSAMIWADRQESDRASNKAKFAQYVFTLDSTRSTIIAAIWINPSTTSRTGYDLDLAAKIEKWPICCPANKAHSAKNRRRISPWKTSVHTQTLLTPVIRWPMSHISAVMYLPVNPRHPRPYTSQEATDAANCTCYCTIPTVQCIVIGNICG